MFLNEHSGYTYPSLELWRFERVYWTNCISCYTSLSQEYGHLWSLLDKYLDIPIPNVGKHSMFDMTEQTMNHDGRCLSVRNSGIHGLGIMIFLLYSDCYASHFSTCLVGLPSLVSGIPEAVIAYWVADDLALCAGWRSQISVMGVGFGAAALRFFIVNG